MPNGLKNFILPTNENDYHPGFLRAKPMAALVIVFLLWQAIASIVLSQQKTQASDLTVSNILAAINRERQIRNLLTLTENSKLNVAAQQKSDDMITRHYFSHIDPEGNYIWPKIVAAGYTPYLQLGENLAIEFYNTESLVSAWMDSPTHRANLLNEGFKDQGMGLAFGDMHADQYHSAITNSFGTLLIKKTTAQPQPKSPATVSPTPAAKPPVNKPSPEPSTATTAPPATAGPATSTPTSSPPTAKTRKKTKLLKDTLKLQTQVKGSLVMVSLRIGVNGDPEIVSASVAENTALLAKDSQSPTYFGSIQLPKYEYEAARVIRLQAQDPDGSADAFEYQLGQVPTTTETSQPPVSGTAKAPKKLLSPYAVNRVLTLAFGGILLTLLLFDAWVVLEKKLKLLDKKINNIFLLLLALLVVAILYFV